MDEFYGWVRGIVCYLCVFNVFMQLLPSGSFRKYVRFFGGLLLMLIVMEPLLDASRLTAAFERTWSLESLREQAAELQITGEGMEELRSEKIGEAYQAEIRTQIEETVRAYGVAPVETELTFSQEEGGFLNIEKAVLTVAKEQGAYGGELDEIKKALQEVYHISSERIIINIQE